MIFEKMFDREEMDLDVEALKGILPDEDLRKLGIIGADSSRDPICEAVLNSMGGAMTRAMNPTLDTPLGKEASATIPNYPSKYSDAEVMFYFQSRFHAVTLYDWIIDNGLLAPGEVSLIIEGIEFAVHIMPHVWITKPEVFQAIMIAYNDFLYDGVEMAAEFESFCESLESLVEAKREQKGKGAEIGVKGNPFHTSQSGQFTNKPRLASDGTGSRSKAKIKKKVKGAGESLKFVFTKNPCGRDARLAGKATRCWDGKEPKWWFGERLAESLAARLRNEPLPENTQAVIDEYLLGA